MALLDPVEGRGSGRFIPASAIGERRRSEARRPRQETGLSTLGEGQANPGALRNEAQMVVPTPGTNLRARLRPAAPIAGDGPDDPADGSRLAGRASFLDRSAAASRSLPEQRQRSGNVDACSECCEGEPGGSLAGTSDCWPNSTGGRRIAGNRFDVAPVDASGFDRRQVRADSAELWSRSRHSKHSGTGLDRGGRGVDGRGS